MPAETLDTSFQNLVLAEIRRRGRITFAEFMSWALYHPLYGYYMKGGPRTGREGDFITNVQAGPLYGELLTEVFCKMWDHLGSAHFTLVELGGAEGRLAEKILRALESRGRQAGVRYHLVETGPSARAAARKRLSRFSKVKVHESLESLEHTAGIEGCVFSNEFFDALPFHRVEWKENRLCELYVREDAGRLREEAGPPSTPALARYLREQSVELEENQRAEISLACEGVLAEVDRLLARGFALTVDYGAPSVERFSPARAQGSLRVFQGHRTLASPFEDAGRCDITLPVDFGRLSALGERGGLRSLFFATQGVFFLNLSSEALRRAVEGGENSQKAVVQQLVHPDGFGGAFQVLVQGKNAGDPGFFKGPFNRFRRLQKI